MFDVHTRYATYPDCSFSVNKYANNNHIAISIVSAEGPISNLTVNIDRIEKYPEDCSCVDTNNFPEGTELIKKLSIGKPCGILSSGYCVYPVYKFDIEKVKEFTK